MLVTLRDYQVEALGKVAAAAEAGVRRQAGQAATGLGKAQPVGEPVLTPWGWRPIGDLQVGDEVIGSDGEPTEVVGVFPQGRRPVVRVRFSDGAAVRCDTEHLWAVRDKYDVYRDRPWRVLPASKLSGRRWRVPLVDPVFQVPTPLPLDPYLLGVLLGDGGLSVKGRVLLHTEHALARTLVLPHPATLTLLRNDGPNGVGGTYIVGGPVGRGRNPVLWAVRSLGLEGAHAADKRVPADYLHASAEARVALLRGLMDADGHVRADGHVELTLANEGLIDDAANLVRSLGGTARKAPKQTSWTHRGVRKAGIAWRLSIALDVCPFRWKADRWQPRSKYPPTRHIEGVEPDGEAECVCIAVDAPDQLYVTSDYVLTHNTVMFCALAERTDGRTLILAHRDELISQAAAKVLEVWPTAEVGVVKAERDEHAAPVVVASVQTLARPARLGRLVGAMDPAVSLHPAPPFGLVVVDECHHAAAESYKAILAGLRAGEPDGPLLLGVSATLDRGDGVALAGIFDRVVFEYSILWGINAGYLSDLRGLRVKVAALDMGSVKKSRGDYEAGSAGAVLLDAGAPEAIVQAWREHAPDRRTLVFTPTVEMARVTADVFAQAGVAAGWVSGETPLEERRASLRAFDRGDLQVMVNCMVLTEGYDAPRTDCVVVARPTKSRALYTQMVGRGTRRHPDKVDCLILDVVGATEEHSLVVLPDLFGLTGKQRKKMGDGSATAAAMAAEDAHEKYRLGKITAQEVELFNAVRQAGIAWVPAHAAYERWRRYERPLDFSRDPETVILKQVDDDLWSAGVRHPGGTHGVIVREVDLALAQSMAEEYVRRHGQMFATSAEAMWRQGPPSQRLRDAAARWRVTVPVGATAGEVSDAINARAAQGRRWREQKARRDAARR